MPMIIPVLILIAVIAGALNPGWVWIALCVMFWPVILIAIVLVLMGIAAVIVLVLLGIAAVIVGVFDL